MLVHWRNASAPTNTTSKTERNLMATLSAVVLAYFFLWCLPHWAYFGAVVTGLPQGVLGAILYAAIAANSIHSSLNFIIYMCIHKEFRKDFFMLFPFSCCAKMHTPLRKMNTCNLRRIGNQSDQLEAIPEPLFHVSSRSPSIQPTTPICDLHTFHHWISCHKYLEF